MARSTGNKVRKSVRASGPSHNVRSAAEALGGKISAATVQMPITNVFMEGDYTGIIYVGSQKLPVNVILDTGSSTLAVDGTIYDPPKIARPGLPTLLRKSLTRTAVAGSAPSC
jgi:hypothetical protein